MFNFLKKLKMLLCSHDYVKKEGPGYGLYSITCEKCNFTKFKRSNYQDSSLAYLNRLEQFIKEYNRHK